MQKSCVRIRAPTCGTSFHNSGLQQIEVILRVSGEIKRAIFLANVFCLQMKVLQKGAFCPSPFPPVFYPEFPSLCMAAALLSPPVSWPSQTVAES